MKKQFAMFFALVALFAFAGSACAVDTVSLYLSAPAQVAEGDEFQVQVKTDATGIMVDGVELHVLFDNAVLEFVEAVIDSAFNMPLANELKNGNMVWLSAGAIPEKTVPSVLATITFKVIGKSLDTKLAFADGFENIVTSGGAAITGTLTGTSLMAGEFKGSLKVTILGPSAARWSLNGEGSYLSGATIDNLPVGEHTVSFSNVAGWDTPANQKVTIEDGKTTNTDATYNQQLGSVQVTIDGPASARWSLDGKGSYESGAKVDNVPVGEHVVSFSDVEGWVKPADKNITVTKGAVATATGAYSQRFGSVKGTIVGPEEARWSLDGVGSYTSGQTVENVLEGEHTVSFTDVEGWAAPAPVKITVEDKKTAEATGTYTQKVGALRTVIIGPSNAMWMLHGKSTHKSGETVDELPIGNYLVSFTDVTNWTKPANRTVTVEDGKTAETEGRYVLAAKMPDSWKDIQAGKDVRLEWPPAEGFDGEVTYLVNIIDKDGNIVDTIETKDPFVLLDLDGHSDYRLRIDFKHGDDVFEGEEWIIETPNRAPVSVRRSPVNTKKDFPVNAPLSWLFSDPDGDKVEYKVYLKASDVAASLYGARASEELEDEMNLVYEGEQTSVVVSPDLKPGTEYRWMVVAMDNFEGMGEKFKQAVVSNDVWTFTTSEVKMIEGGVVSDDAKEGTNLGDLLAVELDDEEKEEAGKVIGEDPKTPDKVDMGVTSDDVEDLKDDDIEKPLEGSFKVEVVVSGDLFNIVPLDITFIFKENEIGRENLTKEKILDVVNLFLKRGDSIFNLVKFAGEDAASIFNIVEEGEAPERTWYVTFKLNLLNASSAKVVMNRAYSILGLEPGAGSLFLKDAFEDGKFAGTFASGLVKEAQPPVPPQPDNPVGGGSSGCATGIPSPSALLLLLPLFWLGMKK